MRTNVKTDMKTNALKTLRKNVLTQQNLTAVVRVEADSTQFLLCLPHQSMGGMEHPLLLLPIHQQIILFKTVMELQLRHQSAHHQNVGKFRNLFVKKFQYLGAQKKERPNARKFPDKFQIRYQERSVPMPRKRLVSKLQNKYQAKYASPSLKINANLLQDIFHGKYHSVNAELYQENNAKTSQDESQRKFLERSIARNVPM